MQGDSTTTPTGSVAIDLAAGSYDLRIEFYLDTVATSLDIDCVFAN